MGMSQPVVLKSNRYGINLILDADMPFGQLEEAILEKFREKFGKALAIFPKKWYDKKAVNSPLRV